MVTVGYLRNSKMQKSHLKKDISNKFYNLMQIDESEKLHETFVKEPYVLQQKRENDIKALIKSLFY
jgi:hypothetical protein